MMARLAVVMELQLLFQQRCKQFPLNSQAKPTQSVAYKRFKSSRLKRRAIKKNKKTT